MYWLLLKKSFFKLFSTDFQVFPSKLVNLQLKKEKIDSGKCSCPDWYYLAEFWPKFETDISRWRGNVWELGLPEHWKLQISWEKFSSSNLTRFVIFENSCPLLDSSSFSNFSYCFVKSSIRLSRFKIWFWNINNLSMYTMVMRGTTVFFRRRQLETSVHILTRNSL